MALVKATLLADLKAISNLEHTDGVADQDKIYEIIANAIEAYVLSGDVIVAGGSSIGSYKVS